MSSTSFFVVILAVVVNCAFGEGDYDYGQAGDSSEGYFLDGTTNGDSGYNYADNFDNQNRNGYGYEAHSEYGSSDGDDGANGSYETSYSYDQEDKPKYSSYYTSSSSGSPYDPGSTSYDDYDGGYDGTQSVPKSVEQPSRIYKTIYNTPGVYNQYDGSGLPKDVYTAADAALRDVQLNTRLDGPKQIYRKFFGKR